MGKGRIVGAEQQMEVTRLRDLVNEMAKYPGLVKARKIIAVDGQGNPIYTKLDLGLSPPNTFFLASGRFRRP